MNETSPEGASRRLGLFRLIDSGLSSEGREPFNPEHNEDLMDNFTDRTRELLDSTTAYLDSISSSDCFTIVKRTGQLSMKQADDWADEALDHWSAGREWPESHLATWRGLRTKHVYEHLASTRRANQ